MNQRINISRVRDLNDFNKAIRRALLGLSFLAGVFALGACNQDPYANQSEEIRHPVKPNTEKVEKHPAVRSDALGINADEYFTFKEDTDGVAQITGQMYLQVNGADAKLGQDYTTEITNLAEFEGATYDPVSGKFTWHPKQGLVDQDSTKAMHLEVQVTTLAPPVLYRKRSIPVFVSRTDREPSIVSVDGLGSRVREGSKVAFTVTVVDPDALPSDQAKPRLLVVASNRSANAAQMISIDQYSRSPNPRVDPVDKTKFIYSMILDSSDQNVTKSTTTLSFGLIAFSRYGKPSAPKTTDVQFITQVAPPVAILNAVYQLKAGVPSFIQFPVYDPRESGRVSATFQRCATSGAVCSCNAPSFNAKYILCTIQWTPPDQTSPQDYVVYGQAVTASPVQGDSVNRAINFQTRLRVLPNPSPSPTPTATPPPAPSPTALIKNSLAE